MSSREDNYSRCIRRDRYGKKRSIKHLARLNVMRHKSVSLILVAIKH